MWDSSHVEDKSSGKPRSFLQAAIERALKEAPRARDYYDSLIQERTGKTGKPIYDIQRGKSRSPSMETIELIATAFGLPTSFFVGPRKSAPTTDLPPTHSASRGDGSITLKQLDLGLSMGNGSNLDDYVEEGEFEFDANLLRTITRSPVHRLFVARGDGDSMMPTLLDSDMVIVDTVQHELNRTDKIWAISLFGAGGIKRLRTVGPGRVEIISDNPNVPNQEVNREDLRILGRVIWVGRRI